MRVSIESKGGFEKATAWLNNVSKVNPKLIADQIGTEGVRRLKSNTPKDTGATASGWSYKVKMTARGVEIDWYNNAHPGLGVNIAKLIELGHGTRTGGYVAPKPYIKQSMDPVFKDAGDKIVREMIK